MFDNWRMKMREMRLRLFYLVYGEYFSDALRNTLTIVVPVAILYLLDLSQMALGIGVGTLLISLTDGPGHKGNKWVTAANSISIFFSTAILISFSLSNFWLTAAAIFTISFLCTLLAIFGSRLALTGTMAIILAIFIIGLHPSEPLNFSLYVLLGGVWYYLVSLIQIMLSPYRSLHQAIFECISATAVLLRAKSRSYDPEVSLDECYRESISMHIKVSEKQELMRTLLLSDRSAMKPTNEKGRRLLHTALHLIDLYEQVTAIHYDYAFVRNSLDRVTSLRQIISLIGLLADELERIGGVFLLPSKQRKQSANLKTFMEEKNALLKVAGSETAVNAYILNKVVKNMEDIAYHITEITSDTLMSSTRNVEEPEAERYLDFLSPKVFSSGSLNKYLSFQSPVFRFSLRLSMLCLLAFFATHFLQFGKYGYWLLLTIVIVAKPRFGLTWKRNIERLSGTFTGAFIGLVLAVFIKEQSLQLLVSSFFLLGFFTFNRVRYAISVLCITAMVVICLNIYHGNLNDIISGRLSYTVFGCLVAFAAAYLFPVWEASQLKTLVKTALEANYDYLKAVYAELWADRPGIAELKLARKNSYLKLARLSEGLQNILVEPQMKKTDLSAVHAIQILSYRINAIIASLSLSARSAINDEEGKQSALLALEQLEYCIEREVMVGGLHAADKEINNGLQLNAGVFSHQLKILVELSAQMRLYFSK